MRYAKPVAILRLSIITVAVVLGLFTGSAPVAQTDPPGDSTEPGGWRSLISTVGCDWWTELFLSDEAIEQLHDFEEECLDTYFHEGERKQLSSIDERIRLTTDRFVYWPYLVG